MNSSGYAILRSGILEHLVAGRLGYPELGAYATIHLQADFRTGIWWGSAPRLLATAPRGTSLRDVQRWMQTLTRIRFLRPFHRHGERGNYPVLIDKYDVKTGALRGMRLNAWRSESWEHPYYEFCALPVAEEDALPVAVAAPSSVSSSQKSVAAAPPAAALAPNLETSVWTFLGIEPCGPISFRTLLESRWVSRNGHQPSVLIGDVVDAWETANREKLPRAARLFAGLSKLRYREKETQTQVKIGEPIHSLTAEEIPA